MLERYTWKQNRGQDLLWRKKLSEFDSYARGYRKIHNDNLKGTGYVSSYFAERKIREILEHIKGIDINEKLNILDLGCGDGLCAFYFRKYFPNAFIYGLDLSEENIKIALSKNINNSDFKCYKGERVPYNDETFDIILLSGVLHHIINTEDRLNILRECHRIIKTKGILFVFEHNPYNPITTKIVKECIFDKDISLISSLELRRLLIKANFQVRSRFIIFLPCFLKKIEFIEKLLYFIPIGGQHYSVCKKLKE